MKQKRYFKSRKYAAKVAENRNNSLFIKNIEVFKMRKGCKHYGMYYVGTYMEYLNFAD